MKRMRRQPGSLNYEAGLRPLPPERKNEPSTLDLTEPKDDASDIIEIDLTQDDDDDNDATPGPERDTSNTATPASNIIQFSANDFYSAEYSYRLGADCTQPGTSLFPNKKNPIVGGWTDPADALIKSMDDPSVLFNLLDLSFVDTISYTGPNMETVKINFPNAASSTAISNPSQQVHGKVKVSQTPVQTRAAMPGFYEDECDLYYGLDRVSSDAMFCGPQMPDDDSGWPFEFPTKFTGTDGTDGQQLGSLVSGRKMKDFIPLHSLCDQSGIKAGQNENKGEVMKIRINPTESLNSNQSNIQPKMKDFIPPENFCRESGNMMTTQNIRTKKSINPVESNPVYTPKPIQPKDLNLGFPNALSNGTDNSEQSTFHETNLLNFSGGLTEDIFKLTGTGPQIVSYEVEIPSNGGSTSLPCSAFDVNRQIILPQREVKPVGRQKRMEVVMNKRKPRKSSAATRDKACLRNLKPGFPNGTDDSRVRDGFNILVFELEVPSAVESLVTNAENSEPVKLQECNLANIVQPEPLTDDYAGMTLNDQNFSIAIPDPVQYQLNQNHANLSAHDALTNAVNTPDGCNIAFYEEEAPAYQPRTLPSPQMGSSFFNQSYGEREKSSVFSRFNSNNGDNPGMMPANQRNILKSNMDASKSIVSSKSKVSLLETGPEIGSLRAHNNEQYNSLRIDAEKPFAPTKIGQPNIETKTDTMISTCKFPVCFICIPVDTTPDNHISSDDADHSAPNLPMQSTSSSSSSSKPSRLVPSKPLVACEFCGNTYANKKNCKRHQLVHHAVVGGKICSFPDCNRICSSDAHLKIHERLHTDDRPYLCHICSKTYKLNSHLTRHIRVVHKKEVKKQSSVSSSLKIRNRNGRSVGKPLRIIRNIKPKLRAHGRSF